MYLAVFISYEHFVYATCMREIALHLLHLTARIEKKEKKSKLSDLRNFHLPTVRSHAGSLLIKLKHCPAELTSPSGCDNCTSSSHS